MDLRKLRENSDSELQQFKKKMEAIAPFCTTLSIILSIIISIVTLIMSLT